MSGFILAFTKIRNDPSIEDDICNDAFTKKGLEIEYAFDGDYFNTALYKPKDRSTSPRCITFADGSFIFYTGTLVYKGRTYDTALQMIYDHHVLTCGFPEVIGDNCLLVYISSSKVIRIKVSGNYRVFFNESGTILSTSLLHVRQNMKDISISKQEALEYTFCGTYFGNQTPIKEIKILRSDEVYEYSFRDGLLCKRCCISDSISIPREYPVSIEGTADLLMDFFKQIISAFGNEINFPITGGFDSRLMVAIAAKLKLEPIFCFVLHKDHQNDRGIAQSIADLLDWNLTMITNDFPDIFDGESDQESKQYYYYDGLGIGGVYQYFSGLDCFFSIPANNLLLDGNGGEIYRNPYRLPNKPIDFSYYLSKTILKYFNPLIMRNIHRREFVDNLKSKVATAAGTNSSTLSVEAAELLYSQFYLSNWLAMNNTTALQFIDVIYPYMNKQIALQSARIPMHQKTLGSYEARLITFFSSELAKIISNYGYSFFPDISKNRILKEEILLRMPHSRLKKLMHFFRKSKLKEGVPVYSRPEFYRNMLDYVEHRGYANLGFVMDEYIERTSITKVDQYSRAISIELLLQNKF